MAVPDPHANDLRIMGYEPKHRTCKTLYCIPRRNDFIEVLWCKDHLPGLPEQWCPAEVLHITSTPEQDCLAEGMILYMASHSWEEQVHNVEILSNYKLRRAADLENDDTDCEENDNPLLQWKFSNEAHDTAAEGDNDEWSPKKERTSGKDRDTLSRAQKQVPLGDRHGVEITGLRNGHATLTVEVQKLKRELANMSHKLDDITNSILPQQISTGAGGILSRLRYRLAFKLQGCLRTVQASTGKRGRDESEQNLALPTGDGIHVGALKARVECTRQHFEGIARQTREAAPPTSVHFFPGFSYTQLPLQCSSAFRVLFNTFAGLAYQLGVASAGDRLEMARKCAAGPQGDVVRILATYHFCKSDPTKPARIYLGFSCGEKGQSLPSDVGDEAAQLFPVLTRASREWNNVDRRFVHELKSERAPLPKLREEASEVEAFSLHWKRAPELGARIWSRSLTEPAQVFGWLDATLPFIQTQGAYLCTEVGGMASDDIWDDLLTKQEWRRW